MKDRTESLEEDLLVKRRHHDPHRFLGLHPVESGQIIRLWKPGALQIELEIEGRSVEVEKKGERGLFVYIPKRPINPSDYRIYHPNGFWAHDPYAEEPAMGELDLYLFNEGTHDQLYSALGAQIDSRGVRFSVWAPNADGVSLVGDFNHWDGRAFPMRSLGVSGVWSLFVPGLQEGEKYKFEIRTREGVFQMKSDPMAFYSELRPRTASIVYDLSSYRRTDRKGGIKPIDGPLNIYEVHLGSWKQEEGNFLNYREIGIDLAKYCKEMGFTHVELLPIMEHPLDESWGYQVTGFFSPTSRYGTPSDFRFLVDHLHGEGIGVILDWVPAHFPRDDFSLHRFDGTALYEHEDPKQGVHPHWDTAIFNYNRKEVANFLLASALFWLDKMDVDGLRVDAVASMIYLNYGREEGEWIPNSDGGSLNYEAIDFLKQLNRAVRLRFPEALMIAEESSSFPAVTQIQGLGFDLKWNLGWMNDTLRYFGKDPIYRKFHHNELTFSLLYAFTESFLSVLSHDEAVHGKGSLLNKMPGSDWEKFGNLRLLYSYMICHPGKKLLFMGGEIGQWREWDCKSEIDWPLLQFPLHRGMFEMVRNLNHFYLSHPPLWEFDFSWKGYEWIDFSDAGNSVLCYLRKGKEKTLLCIHHFTPRFLPDYWIPFKGAQRIKEVFNTDAGEYGGSNRLNGQIESNGEGWVVALPPLATLIFEILS